MSVNSVTRLNLFNVSAEYFVNRWMGKASMERSVVSRNLKQTVLGPYFKFQGGFTIDRENLNQGTHYFFFRYTKLKLPIAIIMQQGSYEMRFLVNDPETGNISTRYQHAWHLSPTAGSIEALLNLYANDVSIARMSAHAEKATDKVDVAVPVRRRIGRSL